MKTQIFPGQKILYIENDINRVLKDLKTFYHLIVILDSFRSTTRTARVWEKDQEAGIILYFLKHAMIYVLQGI